MKRKRIPIPLQDGKTAWLERLTPRMVIELSDTLWQDKRRRMIDDFNAADVCSSDRMIALSQLDSERGLYSKLLHHAVTVDGAVAIIEKAATSKSAENAGDLMNNCELETQELLNTACDLLGFDSDEETSDDGSAKAKKNNVKANRNG